MSLIECHADIRLIASLKGVRGLGHQGLCIWAAVLKVRVWKVKAHTAGMVCSCFLLVLTGVISECHSDVKPHSGRALCLCILNISQFWARVLAYTCYPSIWKAKAGGSRIWGKPEYIMKPCLKKKKKRKEKGKIVFWFWRWQCSSVVEHRHILSIHEALGSVLHF
jgi:hypothetical protein